MRAFHLVPVALLVSGLASQARADRPDTPGTDEIFHFDAGDVVETFDTEHFRIHFTRSGDNAVPAADSDVSGVPDHVEQLGALYEDVLAFYTGELGFLAPVSDGGTDADNNDGRFDVYLVDFDFSADGAFRSERCTGDVCSGFMVQENDFAGYGYPSTSYANRLLASHEFFHAVQAAYSASQGSVIGEGTAVWASERFDESLDDLEGFSASFLEQTDRPLNSDGSGPVDPFTYGSSIFWEYLDETFGSDVIRALWESVASTGDNWFDDIDAVLKNAGASGFADVYVEFAKATLMTGDRADPSRSFAKGDELPELTLESGALPFFKDRHLVFISAYRTLSLPRDGRTEVRAALVGEGDNVEGVRLVMAPLAGDRVGDIVDDGTLDVTLDVTGSDHVLVQVINTRQSGNGARPALCIGDVAEVDDCLAALEPPPDDPPPDDDEPPEGCASTSGMGSLLALALLLSRRRA